MQRRYIYGLYDPREPGVVMFVGETVMSLRKRLACHLSNARRKPKRGLGLSPSDRWVLRLAVQGVRPEIRLLATTTDANWRRAERRFISIWRAKNPDLLNKHKGGNGREHGYTKTFCDKCGTRRVPKSYTELHCPTCFTLWRRKYERSPKRKAYKRAYQRSPKYRAYSRTYQRSPKMRAYKRAYKRTPNYRAQVRKYRRTPSGRAAQQRYNRTPSSRAAHLAWLKSPKGKAYCRDHYQAKKLGLTLAEYRERTVAQG